MTENETGLPLKRIYARKAEDAQYKSTVYKMISQVYAVLFDMEQLKAENIEHAVVVIKAEDNRLGVSFDLPVEDAIKMLEVKVKEYEASL